MLDRRRALLSCAAECLTCRGLNQDQTSKMSKGGHSPNQQSLATSTSFPATDHAHNVADKTTTARSVPQKPLVSEHFLPQVKAAALRNRSWRGGEQCGTGGLAPQHPLIQDWKRKRRTNTLPKSPSPLTQHHISLSDSSTASHPTSNSSLISRNKSCKNQHSDCSESRDYKFQAKKSELLNTTARELHCCQDKDFFTSRNVRHGHRSNDTEKLKKTCSYAEQISHDNSTVTALPNIGLTTSDSTLNTCSLRGKEDLRTHVRKLKNESQMIQDVCRPLAAHTQNTGLISTHDQSSNKPDQPHCGSQVHPLCSTTSSRESTTVGSMSGTELFIASTTSLAQLTSSRSELSSVPSLPTIQSNIQTGNCASNSKMDGKATGRERRSSSLCQRPQQGRDHPCTVVNLRIPFGKVEEWDVPQAKRKNCKKSAVSVDGARLRAASGDGGVRKSAEDGESDQMHSTNDKTTSTLRRLEFIVFNDLPQWPASEKDSALSTLKPSLPSTSNLMASLMQSHPSPHSPHPPPSSHHTSSHSPHWPHSNIPSNMCTETSDSIICTSETNSSKTDTSAPSLTMTTFVPHGLPHTLRYHHLTTRHSPPLQSHMESIENHSMYITSYPRNQCRKRRAISSSTGDRKLPSLETTRERVDSSPLITNNNPVIMSSNEVDLSCHQLQASQKHSKVIQPMTRQTPSGGHETSRLQVEGGHFSQARQKKKHTQNTFAYPDPLSNCSSRFHHRLLRLTVLVADTLNYERSKRKHKSSHAHSHT